MTAIAAQTSPLSPGSERQDPLALTYHRLMLVMLVFAGATILIIGRLGWLQVSTDRSDGGSVANPLLPPRGDLVDRNGIPLARTIDAWSIAVHPRKVIGDPAALAVKLHEMRSEEHTSELQSLMRISYAFFCLKKKNR